MAFFQRPTDYPCLLILDPQNEFETLRKRVEQTTLKSQTVARNRSGVTNVRSRWGLSMGQGILTDKGKGVSSAFFCFSLHLCSGIKQISQQVLCILVARQLCRTS